MGVRKVYVLNHGHILYTGPRAYKKLLDLHAQYVRTCQQRMQPIRIKIPEIHGGWRKKIVLLYKELNGFYGFDKDALRVLSVRNALKDPFYRQVLLWIHVNKAKLKTPRTGAEIKL